jgi:hypothetical protein
MAHAHDPAATPSLLEAVLLGLDPAVRRGPHCRSRMARPFLRRSGTPRRLGSAGCQVPARLWQAAAQARRSGKRRTFDLLTGIDPTPDPGVH